VRIENAGDLIYWTYFMISWEKVKQEVTSVKCACFGRPMNRGEPATDSKGQSYDFYVCHFDKRVVWVRSGRSNGTQV
jgi:hypothetical protein